MKLVLEIDDELMAKVMEITCAKTPEEATLTALEDASTSDWMKEFYMFQPRLTKEELEDMIDPDYDLQAIRDASIWPRPTTPAHETAALAG